MAASSWLSTITDWMLQTPIDGFKYSEHYANRISRYLSRFSDVKLDTVILEHVTPIQQTRIKNFAATHIISLLQAAMTLPLVTESQFAKAKGDRIALYKRGYADLSDIDEARFQQMLINMRTSVANSEDGALTRPAFGPRQKKALLMTLAYPHWPLFW